MFPSTALCDLLAAAFDARSELISRLEAEGTNAYRLFHGSVEGRPGLTVDRYGDLLLVQSFHSPLAGDDLAELEAYYAGVLPGLLCIYNDRSRANSRINNPLPRHLIEEAHRPRQFSELGVNYLIQARHAGQDPWLFLDLRAARRRVMQEAAGKSVLNLFAYTCGVGIAAAKAGAAFVVNVDFAEGSLAVGKSNAGLNELAHRPRFIKSDVFPAIRQLAGIGQPQVVRGKRLPPFIELEARQFDLVFLDPPRYAKSPFGVVDLVNDYPALFKPALLATAEGGTLICCNNVAEVDREAWLDQLQRSARKAGREVREAEWIIPEADFPSRDGQPPLKTVLLRV
ncbi:SAM-dependent methyltransferase [Azospira sp. I13]|uniref:class I SAM-dependent rRNA methyltransferase n=1 Tax=Azospira sp. I13 TaxID=1765050 RepID=UPI000D4F83FF|nr:class I SAM-dependent methyltransferase [Azospira sp. I13]GBG01253.1 SAM-dependent methyltransferase [Azospira sp. I13]